MSCFFWVFSLLVPAPSSNSIVDKYLHLRYATFMKQCRRCLEEKDSSLFSPSKANKDGLHSYCRTCHNAYVRERYYHKDRTPKEKERARTYARTYRYGLNQEKFDALMESQNSSCAVCKETFTEAVRPHVDHDHRCCPGRVTCGLCVRGLLCLQCNVFAGMIETRFETHEAMFSYLHLHLENRYDNMKSLADRAD